MAFRSVSGCSANSMNVCFSVFRDVKLDDPIDFREIQSSRCNVCANQDSVLFFTKSEIDSHSFLLLLMTLNFIHRTAQSELLEGFIDEPGLFAGRDEDQNFKLLMGFQKGVKGIQFLFWLDDHIVLFYGCRNIISSLVLVAFIVF